LIPVSNRDASIFLKALYCWESKTVSKLKSHITAEGS
jgi:hypothetical protein